MRFGIGGVCTDETLRPADAARNVEALGLESLFLGEHTHIPWSRESAYPLGELPRNYWRTLDPCRPRERERRWWSSQSLSRRVSS